MALFYYQHKIVDIKLQIPNCYLFLIGDFNLRIQDFVDFITKDSLFLYTDYESGEFDILNKK